MLCQATSSMTEWFTWQTTLSMTEWSTSQSDFVDNSTGLHDVKERFLVSGLPFWRLQRYNNWKRLLWTSWLFLTLLVTSWLFYHFRQRSFCLGSSVKVQAPSPHSTFSYKRELRMGLGAFTSENFVCMSWESLPRVLGAFPKGRSDGTYGSCGWLARPLETIAKGLGDISYTPKGMPCTTHRRLRSTPITDIGVRDARHLCQMKISVVMKTGFSR